MGNSDYNVIMMGRDTMQSLHHAISVGALEKYISNKKVVLIISPQWFSKEHISPTAYASRFSERLFAEMVKNEDLSYSIKRRLVDRVESYLETGDPTEYARVLLYDKVYVEKTASIPEIFQCKSWDVIAKQRQKKLLLEELENVKSNDSSEKVIASEIDYAALLDQAEKIGEESCTNNDLYIYDDYYNEHVKPSLEDVKDRDVSASYLESQEYDDLNLFLDVCGEVGITPLIVNIPVNGIWYDYTGFPKDGREKYYQNIRKICKDRDVSILDFSDKEYEHYFLKDIMHLGWKGWVYLNEAVYRFYLDKSEKVDYPFDLNAFVLKEDDNYTVLINNYISDIDCVTVDDKSDTELTQNQKGYLEGTVGSVGKTIEIEATGKYGAGIIGNANVTRIEKFFDDSTIDFTSGVSKKDEITSYSMHTDVDGNEFNMVSLQLYNAETGEHIQDILGTGEGEIYSRYEHELDSGRYLLKIRGNSLKADEEITITMYLKHNDVVDFSFSVDKLESTQIDISGLSVISGIPTGAGLTDKTDWIEENSISLSDGVEENVSRIYTMETAVAENQFDSVVLQVYDVKTGEHIEDLNYSGEGHIDGTYIHKEKEGQYFFKIKGNTNLNDETIYTEVYLRQGDICHYEYDVSELSTKRISIKDVNFWHTMNE